MPKRPPKKQAPANDVLNFDQEDFELDDDDAFSPYESDLMSLVDGFMDNSMKLTELTLQYSKKENFTREEIAKIYKENIKDIITSVAIFDNL